VHISLRVIGVQPDLVVSVVLGLGFCRGRRFRRCISVVVLYKCTHAEVASSRSVSVRSGPLRHGDEGDPFGGPVDLYPCCWSTVVRVEGRVIIGRSHAPYVFVVGAPANCCAAAIG
jgi:hypothetical protein